MQEVPTPAWIANRQLGGPTFLVTWMSPKGALALPGIPIAAAAVLTLVTGRPDMFVGILAIGALVVGGVALGVSRFRFLASETWLAAEYLPITASYASMIWSRRASRPPATPT